MKLKPKFFLLGCGGLIIIVFIVIGIVGLFTPSKKQPKIAKLPSLQNNSQQLLKDELLGYCFDQNSQSFYFSTKDDPPVLKKYSLDTKSKQTINQFNGLRQIDQILCQKNFVIFKAQDLSVSENFAGQQVYGWKNFYYNLEEKKLKRLSNEVKSIKPLNENEIVYLYAGDQENYLARTDFKTNVTTKILENFDGNNIELFPIDNQIYYSPLTTEVGTYTHLYLLKPDQKTDQQIDDLENIISVSLLDENHFIFKQEGQSQLYSISNQKFIPLDPDCSIAAAENKGYLYCVGEINNNPVLSKINLSNSKVQSYKFENQILGIKNLKGIIYLVAPNGLYRLDL